MPYASICRYRCGRRLGQLAEQGDGTSLSDETFTLCRPKRDQAHLGAGDSGGAYTGRPRLACACLAKAATAGGVGRGPTPALLSFPGDLRRVLTKLSLGAVRSSSHRRRKGPLEPQFFRLLGTCREGAATEHNQSVPPNTQALQKRMLIRVAIPVGSWLP